MIPILYSVLHLTNNKKNENLNFKKIKKRKFLNDTNSIFKCVILSIFSLVTYQPTNKYGLSFVLQSNRVDWFMDW